MIKSTASVSDPRVNHLLRDLPAEAVRTAREAAE